MPKIQITEILYTYNVIHHSRKEKMNYLHVSPWITNQRWEYLHHPHLGNYMCMYVPVSVHRHIHVHVNTCGCKVHVHVHVNQDLMNQKNWLPFHRGSCLTFHVSSFTFSFWSPALYPTVTQWIAKAICLPGTKKKMWTMMREKWGVNLNGKAA